MKIPYERLIQWLAGPIAILAGWAATQITQHLNLLGPLGVGKDQVAHAIIVGTTFITGALVTYLAHAKWMSNLTKWWEHQVPVAPPVKAIADESSVSTLTELFDGSDVPLNDPGPTAAQADMTEAEAVAAQIQDAPGIPEDEVVHGLAPSAPAEIPVVKPPTTS